MAAFVIEVNEVAQPLDGVLELTGYVHRAASTDELHPLAMHLICLMPFGVKYWFADETEPMHVVALLRHLKQEMHGWKPICQKASGDSLRRFCSSPLMDTNKKPSLWLGFFISR